MSVRVTVEDLETGEQETVEIPDGEYLITCTEPCHVAHVQVYPTKGTHVVTIKGRGAER